MNYLEDLKKNENLFFSFMKGKYHLFYNSNVFFRDIQYAIRSFYEKKDIDISYAASEELARNFIKYLEEEEKFVRLDKQSWKVNFKVENIVQELNNSQ